MGISYFASALNRALRRSGEQSEPCPFNIGSTRVEPRHKVPGRFISIDSADEFSVVSPVPLSVISSLSESALGCAQERAAVEGLGTLCLVKQLVPESLPRLSKARG